MRFLRLIQPIKIYSLHIGEAFAVLISMKYFITTLIFLASASANAYAHDGLYLSLARPYVEHCEARAENAGVSRPNQQILINHCLDDFHIRVSRAIDNEYADYAKASGRDPQSQAAHQDLIQSLHMYENDILTDPVTGHRLAGAAAGRQLAIELGRKLDQRNSMQNQPSLMLDED